MSIHVIELAERIKEKGQHSTTDLPQLLQEAETLADDATLDSFERALACRAAGNALQLLNQFQQALDYYDRAEHLLEILDQPVELGRTLHSKVGMLFSLGRYDELFACSSRARQLFEQSNDHKRLARLDVNLAHAYHRLGRHVEALASSEQAIPILEDNSDFEGLVAALINSAVTLTAMHQFDRATDRYRTAMALAKRLSLSSWILLCRYNLAYLLYLDGNTRDALQELSAVRAEYEAGNNEWMICQCRLDESEVLLEIGDLEECIRAAREARIIGERLGLDSEIGKSLLFEAAARLRSATDNNAFELLDEATRRFAAGGDQSATAVSRLHSALFRGERGDAAALADASAALESLRDSGLPHRIALANIVVGRLERTQGNASAATRSFAAALRLAEDHGSQWMQFHALYELGRTLDIPGTQAAGPFFKRAEKLLDVLWKQLGSDELKMSFLTDRENVYNRLLPFALRESESAAFEVSERARSRVMREHLNEGSAVSAAQISSRLARNETLLEFFVSGNDLFIFAVRADATVCVRREGVVPRIRASAASLERHIDSCSVKWERLESVQAQLHATALVHLHDLYCELIAPIESELRGRLVVVPHGFLHNVPIHALCNGTRHVSELRQVIYSPSASLYCFGAEPPVHTASPLLIAFATGSASSSIAEIEEAAASLNDPTLLINPSCRELKEAFEEARPLIHIAGHAGVDAVGGRLSWIETPEGKITGGDLLEMQIRATTLVITGCRTARRTINPGDEWLGLMRSFYLSGATTIISVQWDIRGEIARRFSRAFYASHGTDYLEAARDAESALRAWRNHPYFWAGFSLFARHTSTGGNAHAN